jgi:uncharacterized protein YggU (UPF0235/DUF167 family)
MQISVKVTAGAKREGIIVLKDNRYKVSVKPKAAQGAANERVLELLSLYLKVPLKNLRIIRGHKTSSKIILVNQRGSI